MLHELKNKDGPQVDRVVTGAKPRPHVAGERGGRVPEMTTVTRLHLLGVTTKNIWREIKKELILRVKIIQVLIKFYVHMYACIFGQLFGILHANLALSKNV